MNKESKDLRAFTAEASKRGLLRFFQGTVVILVSIAGFYIPAIAKGFLVIGVIVGVCAMFYASLTLRSAFQVHKDFKNDPDLK